MSMHMKFTIRHFLFAAFGLIVAVFAAVAVWAYFLNQDINERLAEGWFLPPIEVYSDRLRILPGTQLNSQRLTEQLNALGYHQLDEGQKLRVKEFSIWSPAFCQQNLQVELPEETRSCYAIMTEPSANSRLFNLMAIGENSSVIGLYQGEPALEVREVSLEPYLFAQYYGGEPIIRDIKGLGEIPLLCLQAVTAIEDSDFLTHAGVSISGTLRAVVRNITSGRYAQGGSTITQQLVKNFFLTPEKTIKRKLTEQLMAVLIESRFSKDEILENYLNVIYMGQNGPFQLRGYGSAAKHYFNKPIDELKLSECAMLASLINSPGRYNPFTQPERARTRRSIVLNKMLELEMINAEAAQQANTQELPSRPPRLLSEPAPYYVQAVLKQIDELGLDADKGLKIYTHLNPSAQELGQKHLSQEVERLEKDFKRLSKLKASGKHLQAALLSIDLKTNGIIAMIGGRGFKSSQYNRARDSRRQVGSIMKPFVYLTALESLTSEGEDYSPLTLISDERLDYRYEGQRWTPSNYDNKFHGPVPLFVGLKESLNIATARLGIDVGLSAIVDVARRLGIESDVKALPSLTLGAFELSVWEVARAYAAIAHMGEFKEIRMIRRVEDAKGDQLWIADDEYQTVVTPEAVGKLVGMMKQTLKTGTARSTQWRGFTHPAAGKTGTTSDTKDAWFAGFTPHVLTVVWVGYDDNTHHGLTGSSGAVPLWTNYMKDFAAAYPPDDFTWPEGVEPREISLSELMELYEGVENMDLPTEPVELVY